MNLPESFSILIVTLSDRASTGEYPDKSGPRIREILDGHFANTGQKYETVLRVIPDEASLLQEILSEASGKFHMVFTTGGTGIGPRDITVDVVSPMLDKEIPGIMELIRVKYGMEKPNALLSRSVAGIMGQSLVFTLPGSVRAVNEYMEEICKVLDHLVKMQYGVDAH